MNTFERFAFYENALYRTNRGKWKKKGAYQIGDIGLAHQKNLYYTAISLGGVTMKSYQATFFINGQQWFSIVVSAFDFSTALDAACRKVRAIGDCLDECDEVCVKEVTK